VPGSEAPASTWPPRGSGAAAPGGALRAIDASARPRSWRPCGPRRLRRQSHLPRSPTHGGAAVQGQVLVPPRFGKCCMTINLPFESARWSVHYQLHHHRMDEQAGGRVRLPPAPLLQLPGPCCTRRRTDVEQAWATVVLILMSRAAGDLLAWCGGRLVGRGATRPGQID
jgi:hypothetical protein